MTVRQLLIKRLGALPVIHAYLERLQLKECVDALAPVRAVAHLTNGQVVAALVANRLTAPATAVRRRGLGRGVGSGRDVRDPTGGSQR